MKEIPLELSFVILRILDYLAEPSGFVMHQMRGRAHRDKQVVPPNRTQPEAGMCTVSGPFHRASVLPTRRGRPREEMRQGLEIRYIFKVQMFYSTQCL